MDGSAIEQKSINPLSERAKYWSNKGMPFACEFFAKRAGLNQLAADELLRSALIIESSRLDSMRTAVIKNSREVAKVFIVETELKLQANEEMRDYLTRSLEENLNI